MEDVDPKAQKRTAGNDKKQKRIESKKRKIAAFLELAKSNDEDKRIKRAHKEKASDSPESSDSDDAPEEETSKRTPVQNSTPTPKATPPVTDPVEKKHTIQQDEQLVKLRAELRQRQKAAMARPKLYLILDELQAASRTLEDRDGGTLPPLPPLYLLDLQHLILYAIQGQIASYKPRWCRLLRWTKVSQVVVLVISGISAEDFQGHKHCFPKLNSLFEHSVPMVTPYSYSSTVAKELFSVPLSSSQWRKSSAFRKEKNLKKKMAFDKIKNAEEAAQELQRKEENKKKIKKRLDMVENVRKSNPIFTLVDQSESYPVKSNKDAVSRKSLLLSTVQMIHENYPLPVDTERCKGFVYSQNKYKEVTENSPLFAVDCEMCLTITGKHELTRVSILNEAKEVVYDTYVKPVNPIKNYLTRFSGITKELLDPVTTRLSDVQEDLIHILPPDAIMCGQSLNGDLNALQMFHPYVIDTSIIYNLTGIRRMKTSLRQLTATFLGRSIQCGTEGHSSVEDSEATMDLVLLKLERGLEFGDAIMGCIDRPFVVKESSEECEEKSTTTDDVNGGEAKRAKIDDQAAPDSSCSSPSKEAEGVDKSEAAPPGGAPCTQPSNAPPSGTPGQREVFFSRGNNHYQDFFELVQQSQKSAAMVDVEDVLSPFGENCVATTVACSGNKDLVRQLKGRLGTTDFLWGGMHVQPSGEGTDTASRQQSFEKIDKYIGRIAKHVPENSLFSVVLSGHPESQDTSNQAKCFVKIAGGDSNAGGK